MSTHTRSRARTHTPGTGSITFYDFVRSVMPADYPQDGYATTSLAQKRRRAAHVGTRFTPRAVRERKMATRAGDGDKGAAVRAGGARWGVRSRTHARTALSRSHCVRRSPAPPLARPPIGVPRHALAAIARTLSALRLPAPPAAALAHLHRPAGLGRARTAPRAVQVLRQCHPLVHPGAHGEGPPGVCVRGLREGQRQSSCRHARFPRRRRRWRRWRRGVGGRVEPRERA